MTNEAKNSPPSHACTDEEALEWLRDGSPESESNAMGCLYRRLLGRIRPWVFSRNGSSDDAHDAVTEAVVQFVQNFREGKYKHVDKLEHYLFRMAQFKFFDLLRARGDEVSLDVVFPGGIPPEMLDDPYEKAEEEMENIARHTKLEHCLGQIGERCKERILRFWYMQQSHEEIAKAMGDSSGDVSKVMKNKCQGSLAKCIHGKY
ncbi:MAG: RNA polymerase sigma factor [Saprospiraceae bacterium]